MDPSVAQTATHGTIYGLRRATPKEALRGEAL